MSSSSRQFIFISEQRFVFQSMQQQQQPIEVINPLDDVASDGFVIHLDHHPLPPLPPRPMPTATATPTTTLVATIEPKKPFSTFMKAFVVVDAIKLTLFLILIFEIANFSTCSSMQEMCFGSKDPFTTECEKYFICDPGGIIAISVIGTILTTFHCIAVTFTPTMASLKHLIQFTQQHNPDNALRLVAEHAQSIIDSPVRVGIHVNCSHMETRTEHHTNAQGQRSSRTTQHSVTTFSNTYDFSNAVSSVDSTMFSGRDIQHVQLPLGGRGSPPKHIMFQSSVSIDADPALGELLHSWKQQLYVANKHRDHSISVTLQLTLFVPVKNEQIVPLTTEKIPCYLTPMVFWIATMTMWSSLYMYMYETMFENKVPKCVLLYTKYASLHCNMENYCPTSVGGESLPMQLTRNEFGKYIPTQHVQHIFLQENESKNQ